VAAGSALNTALDSSYPLLFFLRPRVCVVPPCRVGPGSPACAAPKRLIRDRSVLSRVTSVLRDVLLAADVSTVGAASGVDSGDRELVGGHGDASSTKKPLVPAVLQDEHPAREIVVHCLCLLLAAEMADVEDGDLGAFSGTVTSDLLSLLSSEMSAPIPASGGDNSRIRRRISRIGGKFKRGVARLSLGGSEARGGRGGGSSAAAVDDLDLEVDGAVARAVAVVDLLSCVVCFIDHPLLTLAAGEVLVDRFSRDGSSSSKGPVAGIISTIASSPAPSLSSSKGSRRGQDDLLKAEVVSALANIAVLSSQVRVLSVGVQVCRGARGAFFLCTCVQWVHEC
jgi:hypothetical protein